MKKLLGIAFMCVGIIVFIMPTEQMKAKENIFYLSQETKEAYGKEECVSISKNEDFSSWHTIDSFPLVKEVRIEEGTKKLGDYIFFCFPNIEKIVFPASLEDVGSAFYPHGDISYRSKEIKEEDYCLKKLKTVEVNKENAYFTSKDGILYTKDYKKLICYPAGNGKDAYQMPEFTQEIASYAFGYNTNLKKIVLGTRFTWNAGSEFSTYGIIPNLNTMQVASDNAMLSAEDGVLFDYEKTVLITYPSGKKADTYTIPKTVTSLENGCLKNARIGKLILPAGLKCDYFEGERVFAGNQVSEFSIAGNDTLKTEDGVLYNEEGTEMIAWPRGRKAKVLSFSSTLVTLNLREENIPCINTVTKLIIPADARYIWLDEGENSLQSIEVADGNKEFAVYDGLLYTKDLKCLWLMPCKAQKKSVTIPAAYIYYSGTTSDKIHMESVTTVTVNGSGMKFPYQAFPNLKTIKIGKGNKKAKVINDVLYSSTKKTLIWYPQQKQDKAFTVPNTVTTFGDNTFAVQKYITTLNLSKNLNLTNYPYAIWFRDCPKLKEFKVSSGSKYLMGKDGILYSKDGTIIFGYPQGKKDASYLMPDKVRRFRICGGNKYLTSLSFGASFEGFYYQEWELEESLMQFTNLSKLKISKQNPMMYVKENVLYTKSENRLYISVYPAGLKNKTFTIPAEVTDFSECVNAFLKHPYLKEIRSENPDIHMFGKELWSTEWY